MKSEKGNMKLIIPVVVLIIVAVIIFITQGDQPSSESDSTSAVETSAAEISELDVISENTSGLGGMNIHKFLDIPQIVAAIKEHETPENIEKYFAEQADSEFNRALRKQVETDGVIATLKSYSETVTFAYTVPENLENVDYNDAMLMLIRSPEGGPKLLDFSKEAIEQNAKAQSDMSKVTVTELPGEIKGFLIEAEVNPTSTNPQASAATQTPKLIKMITAQLNNELFLFGSEKKGKVALELATNPGSKPTIKNNQDLMASYSEMKDALFWLAYFNPNKAPAAEKPAEPSAAAGNPSPPKVEMEDLKAFLLSLNFENEILQLKVEVNFFDEALAKSVNEAYSGFAYMGAGMAGIPAQQLSISAEGTKITLDLSLTQEMLENISKQAQAAAGQKMGGQTS